MGTGLLWLVVGVVATLAVLPLLAFGMQRSRRDGATAHALGAAFEPLEGLFNPGRLRDLEQRRHEAELPEEQLDGAPPRTRIDLDHLRAVVHLPAPPEVAEAKDPRPTETPQSPAAASLSPPAAHPPAAASPPPADAPPLPSVRPRPGGQSPDLSAHTDTAEK